MGEHQQATNFDTNLTAVYNKLRIAAEDLYFSAVWHADRAVDELALWEALRDAANIQPGLFPKELSFPGVRMEFGIDTLRLTASKIRKNKGEFSSVQVQAFLSLYAEELRDKINTTVRRFLEDKLA